LKEGTYVSSGSSNFSVFLGSARDLSPDCLHILNILVQPLRPYTIFFHRLNALTSSDDKLNHSPSPRLE